MDLLEPMRRASELGCEDFDTNEAGDVGLIHVMTHPLKQGFAVVGGQTAWLPCENKRINRYAACRCECWWRERAEAYVRDFPEKTECLDMIDLCRAFANEHGK